LNHPRICTLYDIGRQDDIDFLVMEFLDGHTLAERLENGPIPMSDALDIAIEIADALAAAHEHEAVHRDLKPANVMLTRSGAKLLDFGVAKLKEPKPPVFAQGNSTVQAGLTSEGVIVGTLHYMAPEQLEAKEATDRSDIWAFGCVLYEMLTGQKAFPGETAASVIASIMKSSTAEFASFDVAVHPLLDHIVRRCLAKKPDDRWHSAHDLALQLRWLKNSPEVSIDPAPAATKRGLTRTAIFVLIGAVLGVSLSVALGYVRGPRVDSSPIRFSIPPPKSVFAAPPELPELAVSPDGTMVAFVTEDDHREMWLRRLDSAASQLIEAAEFPHNPFWSPDSKYIGYWTNNKLYKIAVAGGPPQYIADVGAIPSVFWGNDQKLVSGFGSNVQTVSANGGSPTALPFSCQLQDVLPDDKHLLCIRVPDAEQPALWVTTADGKDSKLLLKSAGRTIYAEPGYLLTVQDRKLLAYPFDVKRLEVQGDAKVIADNVAQKGLGAALSVSRDGVLAYATGTPNATELIWFDRSGNQLSKLGQPDFFRQFRFSPDARQLVLDRIDPRTGNHDIWLSDLSSQVFSRFTSDTSLEVDPVWSGDGREVAYSSDRNGRWEVFVRKVGSETETLVASGKPKDWSKKTNLLLYREASDASVRAVPMPGKDKPLLIGKDISGDEFMISPDSEWVAFNSFPQAGGVEVSIARFPSLADRRQVSNGGGGMARWRADGRELFYISPDGRLMAVQVTLKDRVETSAPKALFDTGLHPNLGLDLYDVTPDGQRFLVIRPVERVSSPLAVVTNWTKLIR
jgi:serine/threonine protein kinase